MIARLTFADDVRIALVVTGGCIVAGVVAIVLDLASDRRQYRRLGGLRRFRGVAHTEAWCETCDWETAGARRDVAAAARAHEHPTQAVDVNTWDAQ